MIFCMTATRNGGNILAETSAIYVSDIFVSHLVI